MDGRWDAIWQYLKWALGSCELKLLYKYGAISFSPNEGSRYNVNGNQIQSLVSDYKLVGWGLEIVGSRPLCTTIFLPTKFACLQLSLHLETYSQNNWSVTNQIEYTGLRQDSYL